jgi:hypothetical protein
MPYIRDIKPNSIDSDGAQSHQTSPSYVITFIPWVDRVIENNSTEGQGFLNTQNPIIVVNDAVNITITDNKENPSKTLSIQLVSTDVNYSAAIHPGDYVFVNILDSEEKSRKIHAKVINRSPINGFDDGFKGYFKVRTVTRSFFIDGNGNKSYRYQVGAMAFSELSSTIMYNPALQSAYNKKGSQGVFMTLVGEFFNDITRNKYCEDLIKLYIKILLGQSQKAKDISIQNYGTTHHKLPELVTTLLGYKGSVYVNEVYNVVTGIWQPLARANNPKEGFNPNFKVDSVNVKGWTAGDKVTGVTFKPYENFNNRNVWSILNDNCNSVMNELYTVFRVNKEGSVVPTIILRQKPFNKKRTFENINQSLNVTLFKDLPRWKVDLGMILNFNFTTNEALRFNFVQTFAETPSFSDDVQIGLGNFTEDVEDIQRHGLKPYISRSRFGYQDEKGQADPYLSVQWNAIIADMVMNAHLKENGTMTCVGIEEPIATGDNLEFDGNLYHIESVTHNWSINAFGLRSFTTVLGLSHGISLNETKRFPEMTAFTRKAKEQEDVQGILPGVSEKQDRRTK